MVDTTDSKSVGFGCGGSSPPAGTTDSLSNKVAEMVALQKIIILFLFLTTLLFSQELQQEYMLNSDTVKLSDIIKSPKKDTILFNINVSRHSKRVRSSELLKKLKSYGYNNFHTQHTYIQFSRKSPINTQKLKDALIAYYQQKYKHIAIENLFLKPTKYMLHLPKNYTIGFPRNAYLSHKGIFYIKTLDNKKFFFNYILRAKTTVYQTKKEIQKGEELSGFNLQKKSIILDKFQANPLMELPKHQYEAKHRLKNGLIVTQRDIRRLNLVKRGAAVVVTLHNNDLEISFTAKALQSGRLGDTISVLHDNSKKIRVRVIGKNRAEVN